MSWAETLVPGLSAPDAARLAALPALNLPAGATLFHAGDAAQGFAFVLEGRIEVRLVNAAGRELLLYAIEPGQSCIQTTLGLLGAEPYSGAALVVTPCKLVMLPAGQFRALVDQSAPFRSFVFRAFAARMSELTRLLEQVAFARIEARLAESLLELARNGEIRMTHAELAARIGSAREVITRQLDRWAARGIVSTERGKIVVVDAQALRALQV
ncbi:MAG: Crp/Fnr family transcriptional regulator [Roseinatronobacter sp.]